MLTGFNLSAAYFSFFNGPYNGGSKFFTFHFSLYPFHFSLFTFSFLANITTR